MAHDASRNTSDGAGIRRRHSTQYEEEILAQVEGVEDHDRNAALQGSAMRSTSADGNTRRTSSSGNDTSMGDARQSDRETRVRHSSDARRTEKRPNLKHKNSDEVTTQTGTAPILDRPGTSSLSLNTAIAGSGGSFTGVNAAQSPSNVTSPSDFKTTAAVSPTPPRGRNRGYSLRSSLFQRNIRERSQDDSIIEMHDVGPSNMPGLSRQPARGFSGKKGTETIVEISPIEENGQDVYAGGDFVPDPVNKSRVQGIEALPNYQSWIQRRAARHTSWRKVKFAYHKARKFVLRINEIPPTKDGRHIDLDPSRKDPLLDERTGKPYMLNGIRSSRYTAWNFLPRQLFAQFSKLANFYFLLISILQMIPGLSTTGTYTTIIPLLFFVILSMAKEGYDDFRRYRLDKVENNREANVLHAYRAVAGATSADSKDLNAFDGPLHWAKTKWHKVQVGDVIRLDRDDAAPADLILLSSKGVNGIAYVETMALDGETNLKSKQAPSSVAKVCQTTEALASCEVHVVVEDPNLDLYNLDGRVATGGQTTPITNNEIFYRGSILRNTPEAIGMVIYSGEECKIRMNSNRNPRIKAPSLQAKVNKVVIVIVIFVIALAIYNTVAYQIWRSSTENHSWYLQHATVAFFPILVSFIILFNTMIPLSLYVSLEIVKLCQMFLLNDIDMYDEVSNTPFEARTSTINEELGQISYIFSDKTGTLTDNIMKFRKLSVAGTAWLHDVDLDQGQNDEQALVHKKRRQKNKGKRKARASETHASRSSNGSFGEARHSGMTPRMSASRWHSSARPKKAQPELSTREMLRYIQHRPMTAFARKARMLLLSVALCHTCLPETSEDGHIDFQASSPDELALVKAAQELDFLVINMDTGTLSLKTYPNGPDADPLIEDYQILDIIEFSSKRKRMSVIVRFPDQRLCIVCKGADSVVMDRLRLATLAQQKVAEIEKRASARKSMEAHEALRRKSEQVESPVLGRHSFSRNSGTIGRKSMGGLGRPSTSSKLGTIRDEVDSWLREREHDVSVPTEDLTDYYTPRPSMQAQGGKSSAAFSEARSSFQDDYDEDLVEETLAIDDAAIIERCFQHINDFATEGLRTLLYAHRFLDEQEYSSWKKVYLDAATSLVDRQLRIEKAGELIEQRLELGGATAIEDKLQNGVPEAIEKLRRAHIKMWMLTGDKRETAINIGHSCRLIKDYSSVTILDHVAGQIEQRIAASLLDVQGASVAHSVIVIDGQTLAIIEAQEALHKLFLDLAIAADSVVCCRASPSQKAGLVKAIRQRVKNSITLAIGDGANDIAMIQEAHVGIGITGKEGLQAARTSDYSIAQFRFLTKLLLVHGHWNYVRICKYTVGTFWKELMFYLVQALYQRFAGYTGTSLYENWSLSLFNTFFTSLCVIFLGIFEKDLLPSTLLAVPELYSKGQRNEGFNFKVYLAWMFMAASESMIVFWSMWGLFGNEVFTLDNDLYAMGDICFTACIILINVKLQILEMHNKSFMAAIALTVSVGGWFLWNVILAVVYGNNVEYHVKGSLFKLFGRNPSWWLTLILIVMSTILFEVTVRAAKAALWPTDTDTFQALEQDLEIRKRFEEASATELQAGWHRGDKKSSLELVREAEDQAKREGEVEDLLNRPRVMENGKTSGIMTEEEVVMVHDNGPSRRSTDIQEMLSRGFGSVKTETLRRSD